MTKVVLQVTIGLGGSILGTLYSPDITSTDPNHSPNWSNYVITNNAGSKLNEQNLRQLAQNLRTRTQHEQTVNKSMRALIYNNYSDAKSVLKPNEAIEMGSKNESPTELKRQTTFINLYKDNATKLDRTKTYQTNYYDTLLQKYKNLTKYASEDYGASNLVKVIEGQILYGKEIKTYRLVDGNIEEVEEVNYTQLLLKEMESSDITLKEGKRNVASHKQEEYKILKTKLKTKMNLKEFIDDSPKPMSLIIIRPFTIIWIILLTVLLVGGYLYTSNRVSKIEDSAAMLRYSFDLKYSLMDLWYNSRELFLVYSGTYSAFELTYPNKANYIEIIKNTIETRSYYAHMLIKELALYPLSNSSEERNYVSNSSTTMYLYLPKGSSSYYMKNTSVFQAISIEIETFTEISKLAKADYEENTYLLDTAIDSLYSSLIEANNALVVIFYDIIESLSEPANVIDYVFFIASAIELLLCLGVDIIFIKFIAKYHNEVMDTFLEVPRKYILYLNGECEEYAAELQNAERENNAENPSEEDEKETDYSQTVTLKGNYAEYKRIYTHKKNIGMSYLVSFILLVLLAEAFFIWQFVLRIFFYDSLKDFFKMYKAAGNEGINYMQSLNVYREYFNDPQTTYGRIEPLKDVVNDYWTIFYELEKIHIENDPVLCKAILSEKDKDSIKAIYTTNLCVMSIFEPFFSSADECIALANKTSSLGLHSVKTYIQSIIKSLIYNYEGNEDEILNSSTLWSISDKEIIKTLEIGLSNSHKSYLANQAMYVIIFALVINFLFAVLCYPLLAAICRYVTTARQMLSIIPIDCIITLRGFDRLILKHLKK